MQRDASDMVPHSYSDHTLFRSKGMTARMYQVELWGHVDIMLLGVPCLE